MFCDKAFGYVWLSYNYSEVGVIDGLTRNLRMSWPDDYTYVRGILISFNASSGDTRAEYLQPYFKEFLRTHQFAFIGSEGFAQPSTNSNEAALRAFTNSLPSFISQSGHTEINYAPFVLWSASAGIGPANIVIRTNASRVIAYAAGSGTFGTPPAVDAAPQIIDVPALLWSGDNDVAGLANSMESFVGTNRTVSGLRGSYAVIQGGTHPISITTHHVGMGFLNEMIALSYSTNECPVNGPVTLTRLTESSGWLVNSNTIRTVFETTTNFSSYVGTQSKAYWLPNKNSAYIHRAFASHSPPISLSSPANETEVNPGSSIVITVNVASFAGWTNVTIFDYSTNLANFTSGTPTFTMTNAATGVHIFSAIATKSGTNVTTRPVMVQVRKLTAPSYPCAPATVGTIYYAATNGTAGGTGSIGSPWDLRTAMTKTATIVGGDYIYLRGGTYTNTPEHVTVGFEGDIWQATISGSYGNPVTIQSYPGEWAIWDGGAFGNGINAYHAAARPVLKVGDPTDATKGRFLWFRNMEFMSSSTNARISGTVNCSTCVPPTNEAFPEDFFLTDGPYVYGQSNIFSNLIIHDLSTGISAWEQSSKTLVYGCVIYNNGWVGVTQLHGHGVYTQNKSSREAKTFATNIWLNNYDNSIQAYGSSGSEVYHYRLLGNIAVNNRILVGGRQDTAEGDNQILGNWQYNSDLVFIYQTSVFAVDMLVANNYVGRGGLQGGSWQSAMITNNTVINPPSTKIFDIVPITGTNPPSGWTVNRNRYHYTPTNATGFRIEASGPNGVPKTFPQWQAMSVGWDANSSIFTNPTTNLLVLQANIYDTNRAQIAAFNWATNNSVTVSLASLGWSASDSIRVRNAQDYFVDITTNSIPGNVLTLNMLAASHSVALPHGSTSVTGPKTFPQFGAFVIERIGFAPPTPTNTITITSSPTGATVGATTDINGNGSGTATFARNYLFGTPVTLTASLTFGTNNFSKWQLSGVDFSNSNVVSFTVTTNVTWNAVYVAPPVVTWTLNMASSNPGSGVVITNSPNDNNGAGQGTTPFSRVYNDGVVITISAPATASGNDFSKWQRGGVDFTTSRSFSITANSSSLFVNPQTFTAVYVTPALPVMDLLVNSVNPASGVAIVVSVTDTNGLKNGTTAFTRSYPQGASVTLSAPLIESVNGNTFVDWQDGNGASASAGSTNVTVILNTSQTRSALYTNTPAHSINLGSAKNRRRGSHY